MPLFGNDIDGSLLNTFCLIPECTEDFRLSAFREASIQASECFLAKGGKTVSATIIQQLFAQAGVDGQPPEPLGHPCP